jgi:hypothetical protein
MFWNSNAPTFKLGRYEDLNDRIRIEYENGFDSVLFEDISSISCVHLSKRQYPYILWIMVLSAIISELIQPYFIIRVLTGIILVYCFICNRFFPLKWNNIIIETRGGKELFFSQKSESESSGLIIVNKIEELKRLRTGKN